MSNIDEKNSSESGTSVSALQKTQNNQTNIIISSPTNINIIEEDIKQYKEEEQPKLQKRKTFKLGASIQPSRSPQPIIKHLEPKMAIISSDDLDVQTPEPEVDSKEQIIIMSEIVYKYRKTITRYSTTYLMLEHLLLRSTYEKQITRFLYDAFYTMDGQKYKNDRDAELTVLKIKSSVFLQAHNERLILFDVDLYYHVSELDKSIQASLSADNVEYHPLIDNRLVLSNSQATASEHCDQLAYVHMAARPIMTIGYFITPIFTLIFLYSNVLIPYNFDNHTLGKKLPFEDVLANHMQMNQPNCIDYEEEKIEEHVDDEGQDLMPQMLSPLIYPSSERILSYNNNIPITIKIDSMQIFTGFYGPEVNVSLSQFILYHNKMDIGKLNLYVNVNGKNVYDQGAILGLSLPNLMIYANNPSFHDIITILVKGRGGSSRTSISKAYNSDPSEFYVHTSENVIYANIVPANASVNKSIIISPNDTFATSQLTIDVNDIQRKQQNIHGTTIIAKNDFGSLQVADIYNFLNQRFNQDMIPLPVPRPFSSHCYNVGWYHKSDIDDNQNVIHRNVYHFTDNMIITSKEVGLCTGNNVSLFVFHEVLTAIGHIVPARGLRPYTVAQKKIGLDMPTTLTLSSNFNPNLAYGNAKLKDIANAAHNITPIIQLEWLDLINKFYAFNKASNDYTCYYPSVYYRMLQEYLRIKNIEDGIYVRPVGPIAMPMAPIVRVFKPNGVRFGINDYIAALNDDSVLNINLSFCPTQNVLDMVLACLLNPHGMYQLTRVNATLTYTHITNIITLPTYTAINIFYNQSNTVVVPANISVTYTSDAIMNVLNSLVVANNDVMTFNYALDLFIGTCFCVPLKPDVVSDITVGINNANILVTDSLSTYGNWFIYSDFTAHTWLRGMSATISMTGKISPTLLSNIYDVKDLYTTMATRAICNFASYCITLDSFGLSVGLVQEGMLALTDSTCHANGAAAVLLTIFNNKYNGSDYSIAMIDYRIRLANYVMFGYANSVAAHNCIYRDRAFQADMVTGRYSLYANINNLRPKMTEAVKRYTPISFPFLVLWREFYVVPTSLYAPMAGLKTDYIGTANKYYNVGSNDLISYIFQRNPNYNTSYITTVQSPDGHLQFNIVEWDNNICALASYMRRRGAHYNILQFTTRTGDVDANYVPIEANIIVSTMYVFPFAVAHQGNSINYDANAIDCVAFKINEVLYTTIKTYGYGREDKTPLVCMDQFSNKLNLNPDTEKIISLYDDFYNIEKDVINYINHNISNVYNPTTIFEEDNRIDTYDLDFPDFFETNKDGMSQIHKDEENKEDKKHKKEKEEDKKEEDVDEKEEKKTDDVDNNFALDNRKNVDNILKPLGDVDVKRTEQVKNLSIKTAPSDVALEREEFQQIKNIQDQNVQLLNQEQVHAFEMQPPPSTKSRHEKVLTQSTANIPVIESKTNKSAHQQNVTIGNNLGGGTNIRKPPVPSKQQTHFTYGN